MDIKELDVVALTQALPDEGLRVGAVGTVVHIFTKPDLAYEVEFVDEEGRTTAMATLTAGQFRLLPAW